jgi:hypothetical protein
MMKQVRSMMVVVVALLGAAVPYTAAGAEPATESQSDISSPGLPAPANEVLYQAKTEIDFGERKVNGKLSGPMGIYADSLADQRWNPLIRLRRSFDREILASVDGVR